MCTHSDIKKCHKFFYRTKKYNSGINSGSFNKKKNLMAFNYVNTYQSSDGAPEVLIGLLPLLGRPIVPDKRKKRSLNKKLNDNYFLLWSMRQMIQ
jgi:hypothetical protein